jgi:hypothetical protein
MVNRLFHAVHSAKANDVVRRSRVQREPDQQETQVGLNSILAVLRASGNLPATHNPKKRGCPLDVDSDEPAHANQSSTPTTRLGCSPPSPGVRCVRVAVAPRSLLRSMSRPTVSAATLACKVSIPKTLWPPVASQGRAAVPFQPARASGPQRRSHSSSTASATSMSVAATENRPRPNAAAAAT